MASTNVQKKPIKNINDYISQFPKSTQVILEKFRLIIKESAPSAKEDIVYSVPTFKLNGNLVHFGAYEKHIGFYPAPTGIAAFKKELSEYKHAKGSVQFPLDKPIPYDLIKKIVKYRVKENKSFAVKK